MVSEFWARLEDVTGRVVGDDPAWKPQRQFLWDVVHDTRGLLREEALYDDLEYLRKIDSPNASRPDYALDPARLRRIYRTIVDRARSSDAKFRLVATENGQDWAAAQFFEESGTEYALVGGWTGPFLRTISPEPDQSSIPEGNVFEIGSRRFLIRAVPYAEYFAQDFESLLALLEQAEREGRRVRFMQR